MEREASTSRSVESLIVDLYFRIYELVLLDR
jgi:hypothetical protein